MIPWIPAASVYFKDPDGHSLEFIAMLPEPPQPECTHDAVRVANCMHRPVRRSASQRCMRTARAGRGRRTRPSGRNTMANETIRLAEYAAALRYEDLPPHVVQRAKDCITDTVAVIVLGNASALEPDHQPLRREHRRRRTQPHPGLARADVACAGGGSGQRHAGARVRVRQSDQTRRRRASRCDVAAAWPRGRAGARQFRAAS